MYKRQEQLGTGHAVLSAGPAFHGYDGNIVVIPGDVPLLTPETIEELVNEHSSSGRSATVLTMHEMCIRDRTHQRVTWVWECEEESDAAASLLMFPATCADAIWKHLDPRRRGGSVARLTHQQVDILKNGPWMGRLPPKLARQRVIPLRRPSLPK